MDEDQLKLFVLSEGVQCPAVSASVIVLCNVPSGDFNVRTVVEVIVCTFLPRRLQQQQQASSY